MEPRKRGVGVWPLEWATYPYVNGEASKDFALHALRILTPSPLLASALIFLLLIRVPQMSEVYLAANETLGGSSVVLGLLGVGLVCFQLYMWNWEHTEKAIDRSYPAHLDPHVMAGLRKLRDQKSLLCGIMPLLGLAIGLAQLFDRTQGTRELMQAAMASFEGMGHVVPLSLGEEAARGFRILLSTAFVFVLLGTFAYFSVRGLRRRTVNRLLMLTRVLAVATVSLPLVTPHWAIAASKSIGPLGVTALTLSALLAVAEELLRRAGGFAGLVMGVVLFIVVTSGISALSVAKAPAQMRPVAAQARAEQEAEARQSLSLMFRAWLSERRDRKAYAEEHVPYPVFIVAAQGGGIYAGATVLEFLVHMQSMCPHFSQHVFGLSAVSGGAVGSALFASMVANSGQQALPVCSEFAPSKLRTAARDMILDDHLSPVIAFLTKDFASAVAGIGTTSMLGPGAGFDRAAALEESFTQAFARSFHGASGSNCGVDEADGPAAPFQAFWCPQTAVPGLLFGTTWSEKGYRVVFSPFKLAGLSDGTGYALSDFAEEQALNGLPLMKAAVVSARFPIVMPEAQFVSQQDGSRFTLVDGGYSDGSGGKTALDVYRALRRVLNENPDLAAAVDLRLVVLTDSDPDRRVERLYGDGPEGVVAQLSAFTQVRAASADLPVLGSAEQPLRIYLGNTFPLALGWVLSSETYGYIRFVLGEPALCRMVTAGAKKPAVKDIIDAVVHNSCAKQELVSLLSLSHASRE